MPIIKDHPESVRLDPQRVIRALLPTRVLVELEKHKKRVKARERREGKTDGEVTD